MGVQRSRCGRERRNNTSEIQQIANSEQGYVNQISALIAENWAPNNSQGNPLEVSLNSIISAREANTQYGADVPNGTSSFVLTQAEESGIFSSIVDATVTSVENATGLGLSNELLAVAGVEYDIANSPSLNTFTNNGERPGGWFEIRFNSNEGSTAIIALAERAYVESQVASPRSVSHFQCS